MNNTKSRILEAAKAVLLAQGSGGFSVRKVAQEAGISLGNLQYHFSSRTELLSGLLKADINEYNCSYTIIQKHVADGSTDQQELLHRAIHSALSTARDETIVALSRALFSFHDPEVLPIFDGYYSEICRLMSESLALISGQKSDSPGVKRALSFIVPYLDGYESTSRYLPLDLEEIANLLTAIASKLLVENTCHNCQATEVSFVNPK